MKHLKGFLRSILMLFATQATYGQLECGYRMIATSIPQNLTNPGWPSAANEEIMCTWDIVGQEGYRVEINFEKFNLKSDEVLVIMSDSDTVSMTGSPCLQPYISSSHQVQVTFRSTSGHGIFFAFFRTTSSYPIHLMNSSSLTPAPCGFEAIATVQLQKLNSPGWPGSLDSFRWCSWVISAAPGFLIQLKFISFSIESNELQIVESTGYNVSLSGYNCPEPYVSHSNELNLFFASDPSYSENRFQILFNAVFETMEENSENRNDFSNSTNSQAQVILDSSYCSVNKSMKKFMNCIDMFLNNAPYFHSSLCQSSFQKATACIRGIESNCSSHVPLTTNITLGSFNNVSSNHSTTSFKENNILVIIRHIIKDFLGVEENITYVLDNISDMFCSSFQHPIFKSNFWNISNNNKISFCNENEIVNHGVGLLKIFIEDYYLLENHQQFCRLYKTFIKNLTSHLKEQCEESAIPIILRNILPQKYDKYIPSIISAMKSALHYLQSYEISGCASAQPFCESEQIEHNGSVFTFNQTKLTDNGVSQKLCNFTGLPLALVPCAQYRNDMGVINFMFNASEIKTFSCGTSLLPVYNNTREGLQTLEYLSSQPNLLSPQNIDDAANILTSYLNLSNEEVSEETLTQAAVTVANLITSRNRFDNETKRSSSTKSTLLRTLNGFASKLTFPANMTQIKVMTPEINLQIQQYSREILNETNEIEFDFGEETNSMVEANISPDTLLTSLSSNENKINLFATVLSKNLSLDSAENTSQVVSVGTSNPNITLSNITISFPNISLPKNEEDFPQNPVKRRLNQARLLLWNHETLQWTHSPCHQQSSDAKYQCSGVGSFAIVFTTRIVPSVVVLSVVSYIGTTVSILFLFATIFIYLKFEDLRKKPSTIVLVNICFCMILVYIIFAIGVNKVGKKSTCDLSTFLLHFALLSCLTWMALNAYQMHKAFASVIIISKFNTYAFYLVGYGLPFLLVLINISITVLYLDRHEMNGINEDIYFESLYRARFMCWLQPPSFHWGFLLPIGLLLIYNYTVFAILLQKVARSRSIIVRSTLKDRTNLDCLINAISMVTMMGLTWVFGYFLLIPLDVTYQSIMQWLFTIFNVFQGIGIFYFYCLRMERIRKIWICGQGKHTTSSTNHLSLKVAYGHSSIELEGKSK